MRFVDDEEAKIARPGACEIDQDVWDHFVPMTVKAKLDFWYALKKRAEEANKMKWTNTLNERIDKAEKYYKDKLPERVEKGVALLRERRQIAALQKMTGDKFAHLRGRDDN